MPGFLRQLAARLRNRRVVVTITVDDDRVAIQHSVRDQPIFFLWSDIDEIQTFKRDLWTVDSIRLAVRVADTWHEIGKDAAGFMPLIERLQTKFPSIPAAWYLEVMFPAFETNQRVLWKRD